MARSAVAPQPRSPEPRYPAPTLPPSSEQSPFLLENLLVRAGEPAYPVYPARPLLSSVESDKAGQAEADSPRSHYRCSASRSDPTEAPADFRDDAGS